MVFIQHTARKRHVYRLASVLRPWQRDQGVEIGADDGVFWRRGGNLFEPRQLAHSLLERLLRHVRLLDLGPQLVNGRRLFTLFAQLPLDGLELLAQKILALGLAHLFLGFMLDLLAQLEHLELARQEGVNALQLVAHGIQLEQLLAQGEVHLGAAGDEIHHLQRILEVHDRHCQLIRQVLHEAHEPLEQLHGGALERLDLDILRRRLRREMYVCRQKGLLGGIVVDNNALEALDDHLDGAVGNAQQPRDPRDGADAETVVGASVFDLAVFLGDEAHQPGAAHHLVYQPDRAFLSDT